jgi:two-component system response regulator HydG
MRLEDLRLEDILDVDPNAGEVRFAGRRSLIVDADAIGVLRQQLFATLGPDHARTVLARFGFAHGWRTADAAATRFAFDNPTHRRDAGGLLHMLQGLLCLDHDARPLSPEGATVRGSFEAEQHLAHLGPSDVPVCATLCGFASGYLTRVEDRPIDVHEDRCVARGDAACHFVARPAEPSHQTLPERHVLDHIPSETCPEAPVAASPAMRAVLDLAARAAATPSTILLTGETGTGKEHLARWIHARSAGARGPFVPVHCAAIPEHLLESELFGHVRGAFTGATRDRPGLFEAADGGTLFLDEIGEMPPAMQVKLLRALQTHEIRRVGDDRHRQVRVRVLAATHRDLSIETAAGRFRDDLAWRLRVIELELPPLRARRDDILPLAHRLLAGLAARLDLPIPELAPELAARLLAHDWPGNVRELEHALERALALSTGRRLGLADLPPSVRRASPARDRSPRTLAALEQEAIAAALARHGGHQAAAAAELGISASTLYRRLRSRRT